MTLHEIMQKAVDEGYRVHDLDGIEAYYSGANAEYSVWTRIDNASSLMLRLEETFLDPLFWQALGCALGWEQKHTGRLCDRKNCDNLNHYQWPAQKDVWLSHWHRFIDHLASGESPASFFELYE